MAYFSGNIYSDAMLVETQLHVILPQDGRNYTGNRKPKTLILLHGLSDNASTWMRLSSVERYTEAYNLAVVMPEVQRSWYHDMVYGQKPFTYITEELPGKLSRMFQVSVEREDMMIAGWSMGGYGALKCALTVPEVFSCCGALSGAYDLQALLELSEKEGAPDVLRGLKKDLGGIFGEKTGIPNDADIPSLIEKGKKEGKLLPDIYMSSGTDDFLYPVFGRIRDLCRANLEHYFSEEFDGGHDWKVCDQAVMHMLEHFLKQEKRQDGDLTDTSAGGILQK